MVVSRAGFANIVTQLLIEPCLALDTETFGLRSYHGDRLFSIIISNATENFYFNFHTYDNVESELVLGDEHIKALSPLFSDANRTWYIQNAANFDLGVLAQEYPSFDIAGIVHCTRAIGRVEFNDHLKYSLEDQGARIGFPKDDAVKKYIDDHDLKTKVKIPGKADLVTLKHFDRVPFNIIVPYGEQDGRVTFELGKYQEKSILAQDAGQPKVTTAERSLQRVMENERRLQKTIFRMRDRGILIDRPYCIKAAAYEADRAIKAQIAFKNATGRDFKNTSKVFETVFGDEKDAWKFTDKGNPSFKSDILKNFKNPAAKEVLNYRDAKSKSDFYQGFLYHADPRGHVHPNFNPEGTVHGRFSSSEPNFQNLTSEIVQTCKSCGEEYEEVVDVCLECGATDFDVPEFLIRRAIIPRPGFVFIMPDYDQMEYRFMLEQACRLVGFETPLVKLIKSGLDVHAATVQNTAAHGKVITRGQAKTTNFLTLYGGGIGKLALGLKIPYEAAAQIRGAIFQAAPEMKTYIDTIVQTAEKRRFIINWMGRRCHFANRNFAYKAPNYHISGGCADIVKVAMNRIDESLLAYKSKMVMSVHDELPTEIHESEIEKVPRLIKAHMEGVYESKFMPITTGMEWSDKSLGDKRKGYPV